MGRGYAQALCFRRVQLEMNFLSEDQNHEGHKEHKR
jgi:hypothetical protein